MIPESELVGTERSDDRAREVLEPGGIGESLGRFDMYVGYLTVTFTVTKPRGRSIAVWQGRHLVAELDPAEVDKECPRVGFRDATYGTMTDAWRDHFTRWVVRVWRERGAAASVRAVVS